MLIGARASRGMGKKTHSTSTGSWVRRTPVQLLCLGILLGDASGRVHGWARVRDVSLPKNPVPSDQVVVPGGWMLEADKRGINVSWILDSVAPGPGRQCRTQIGWEALLQDRLAGGGGSGFWYWCRVMAMFKPLF